MTESDTNWACFADIRDTVTDLVHGRSLDPGRCANWDTRHADLAESHSLGPWLFQQLRRNDSAGLDENILARFRKSYRNSAIGSLIHEAAIRAALPAFRSERIPVILLKGAYLGKFVYLDRALRPMCDVDLLVREEHFSRAQGLLETMGFACAASYPPGYLDVLVGTMPYSREAPVVQAVDLHRRITAMDYYRIPGASLWEDAREGTVGEHEVFFLSAEMNFVHIALHALNHGAHMRDRLDLMLMIRTLNLDWDRVISLAQTLRVSRPMYWALEELQSNWRSDVPAEVITTLRALPHHWIEDRVIRGRFLYAWRILARVGSIYGWRPRLHYLRMVLMQTKKGSGTSPGVRGRLDYLKSRFRLFSEFYHQGRPGRRAGRER